MQKSISIEFASDREEILRIAECLESLTEELNLPQGPMMQVQLSVEELFTNIVSYGFEDGGDHTIEMRVDVDSEAIRVELIDDAKAFDPTHDSQEPDHRLNLLERRIGGEGVHLVKAFMDEFEYERRGDRNCVRLMKLLFED